MNAPNLGTVNSGDRIAQFVLERIATVPIVQVEDLDDTVRGAGGFGSTGGFGSSSVSSSVADIKQ